MRHSIWDLVALFQQQVEGAAGYKKGRPKVAEAVRMRRRKPRRRPPSGGKGLSLPGSIGMRFGNLPGIGDLTGGQMTGSRGIPTIEELTTGNYGTKQITAGMPIPGMFVPGTTGMPAKEGTPPPMPTRGRVRRLPPRTRRVRRK